MILNSKGTGSVGRAAVSAVLVALTLAASLATSPALAQRSEPLPYSDDEPKQVAPPPKQAPTYEEDEGELEPAPPPRRKKTVTTIKKSRKEERRRGKQKTGVEVKEESTEETERSILEESDPETDAERPETLREETEREYREKKITPRLFRQDDPYLGLGAELMTGLLLLDRTRGGVEAKLGLGLRAVWEFGRMFDDERVQDHLFADLTWLTTSSSGGTQAINSTTRIHDFTLAPAYLFRLDERGLFGAYLQLGGGFSYGRSTLHYGSNQVRTAAISPLFQYGGGFRFRLGLSDSGKARITARLELTRFRRGYMDDTYIGLGLGATL